MSILINLMLGIWCLVALLMMLVILMQRPKSEGLGAAFGGGVTENIFGAQTTNVLVKFTSWLAGIFFFLTFILSIMYAHRSMAGSSLSRELKRTAPADASPAASAAAGAAQASAASSASPNAGGAGVSGSAAPPAANSSAATTSPAAASNAASPPAAAAAAAGNTPATSSPRPTPKR